MIPAVVYAAKSTADPRGSIPTQLADARAAALSEGREIVAEHHDEAASAFKGNRGQGLTDAKDDAIRLAAERGSAELWLQHSDRLARGDGITADHLAEVWFALRRHGVRVRSVQDDSNLEDVIRVVLIGERNHEDSHRKSEAVKSGLRRRESKLMHHGGPRRYGYEYACDEYGRTVPDQPMQVVPAEAPVVEGMFRDFVAGVSQTQIARAFNARGVRTAAGKSWYQSKVSSMLRNPLYAGLAKDANGALVEAEHDAIISRDLWEERRRCSTRKRAHPARDAAGHRRRGTSS